MDGQGWKAGCLIVERKVTCMFLAVVLWAGGIERLYKKCEDGGLGKRSVKETRDEKIPICLRFENTRRGEKPCHKSSSGYLWESD